MDPLLAGGLAATALVAIAARRTALPHASRARRLAPLLAVLVLALAWLSPLQTLGAHYLLTAHLVQVTLVMGLVPPLLLLGLPDAWRAPVPARLRAVGGVLVHPVTAMIAVNVVFFGWHLTAAYDASLQHESLYALQQLSLLAVSLMFWWPIVAPCGQRRVLSRWGTLGYILVATIPQTFGGITVALAKHTLYATYDVAPRVLGLSPLTDQQVAGACIALVSKVALFTAFGIIFMRMLNEVPGDDSDDGGGGGGRRRPGAGTPSPQPSGSVPWLADINSGRTVPEPMPRRVRIRVPAGAGSRRG